MRLRACAVALAFAAVLVGASATPSAARATRHDHVATTTTAIASSRSWADTVQIDRVDGNTLDVHSVRHPELAPYIVAVDQDTIYQRAPGSPFAPQPGLDVGSRFYFTGASATGGTPPAWVRAVRIFP
jgi:hypothetical protein